VVTVKRERVAKASEEDTASVHGTVVVDRGLRHGYANRPPVAPHMVQTTVNTGP